MSLSFFVFCIRVLRYFVEAAVMPLVSGGAGLGAWGRWVDVFQKQIDGRKEKGGVKQCKE
jgi:hypothetical protein